MCVDKRKKVDSMIKAIGGKVGVCGIHSNINVLFEREAFMIFTGIYLLQFIYRLPLKYLYSRIHCIQAHNILHNFRNIPEFVFNIPLTISWTFCMSLKIFKAILMQVKK